MGYVSLFEGVVTTISTATIAQKVMPAIVSKIHLYLLIQVVTVALLTFAIFIICFFSTYDLLSINYNYVFVNTIMYC